MSASSVVAALAQLHSEVGNVEKALAELIRVKKMMAKKSMNTGIRNMPAAPSLLQQTPIAIVGMASIFPEAENLQNYWDNILHEVDCITDVPPSRWSVEDYYDPDPSAPDKTYCKRGGFIPDIDFNPIEFGLPPNILEYTDISQLLSLVVAKRALEDAGYAKAEVNHERTGVILGTAVGRQLGMPYGARLQYPIWERVLKSSGLPDEDIKLIVEKMKLAYVAWDENSFPGMLSNVIAGRIANRLNFGGTNCTIDAACASSLAAFKMAISELLERRCDMMLAGGVDTDNSIFAYLCFTKTPAMSREQQTRPFDADSDGMMLGEGIGIMVLKRLEDAVRDGDCIYAVIKGMGTSSDGKFKSIYAPRLDGQVQALNRAYQDAGISPATIGLVEAHGTGTVVGDVVEFGALNQVFSENQAKPQSIAIGSVKSQIGHTKAAAGAASLIKAALALHHKVLPATLNIEKPNPKLEIEKSPFYLNTKSRPWIRAEGDPPRRAGVSSFGFGGTNYHIILEEYQAEHQQAYRVHSGVQTVLLHAQSPVELLAKCEEFLTKLESASASYHYAEAIAATKTLEIPLHAARVGFVSDSINTACKRLQVCIQQLKSKPQAQNWEHPQGVYYRASGLNLNGKVVALFAGQGSQYLNMGRELAMNFPEMRQTFGAMDVLLLKSGLNSISSTVFPLPVFEEEQKQAQTQLLQRTEYSQPAIGALSVGMYKILQQAGFKPDFVAGHSFGELTALWAAGVFSDADYYFLVKSRGLAMATPVDATVDAGAMLAVKGEASQIQALLQSCPQVSIANWNAPDQVVLAGSKAEIIKLNEVFKAQGITNTILPVSAAFHTPRVAHAQQPFAQAIDAVTFHSPQIPVYTNTTGSRYPTQPNAIQANLKQHLVSQVQFKQEIEAIYAEGGYCFVEFGCKSILTNLVKSTLANRPHLAIALNPNWQKDSDLQLREAIVQLRVAGLALKDPDIYHQPATQPTETSKAKLSVCLSASNYVSDKTRLAFEQALQDGHQVTLSPRSVETAATMRIEASISAQYNSQEAEIAAEIATAEKQVIHETDGQLASKLSKSLDFSVSTASVAPKDIAAKLEIQPMSEKSLEFQTLITTLESHLTQFSQHQAESLQVHQQYLSHQTEYAKIFFQLMQQQHSLYASGNPGVIEALDHNMSQFHRHQAETLRVHEQALQHQIEYTRNYSQIIQQQYCLLRNQPLEISSLASTLQNGTATNGTATNGAVANGTATNGTATVVPAKEAAVEPEEIPAIVGSAAVVSPTFAQSTLPTHSNGHHNGSSTSLSNGHHNGSSNGSGKDLKAYQEPPIAIAPPITVTPPIELAPEVPLAELPPVSEPVISEPEPMVLEAATLAPDVSSEASDASSEAVRLAVAEMAQALLEIVSEKTGYPAEMLEMEMDMEADLGIDSIKRVEILGAMQERFPEAPKAKPEELGELRTLGQIVDYTCAQIAQMMPLSAPVTVPLVAPTVPTIVEPETPPAPVLDQTVSLEASAYSSALLEIVSEKTGYPAEMLEMEMDMEADLGIDSIKRVEILGAMQERFPEAPKAKPEELGELRTLGQIINYIEQTSQKKTVLAM